MNTLTEQGTGGTGTIEDRIPRDPDDLALRARLAARCRARDRAEDEAAAELAEPEPPTEEDLWCMYRDFVRERDVDDAEFRRDQRRDEQMERDR